MREEREREREKKRLLAVVITGDGGHRQWLPMVGDGAWWKKKIW